MNVSVLRNALLLVAFFLTTITLVVAGAGVVNSPDERANQLFAQRFAQDYMVGLHEPLNPSLGGILGPRSMVAVGDWLLPRSFLGITVVFGAVASVFGEGVLLYLTPVLAVLLLLAWYQVVEALFKDKRLAWMATFLVAVHPAFWYYSARTMMHNVGFVAFLVFGAWFFVKQPTRFTWLNVICAGAMVGLALAFRTSEIIWVAPAVLVLLLLVRPVSKMWKHLLLFGMGVFFFLLPFGFLNQAVYGGFLTTGYTVEVPMDHVVGASEEDTPSVSQQETFNGFLGVLFPFGIHEKAILRHVWQYGFLLYPWMSLLPAMGFLILVMRKEKKWTVSHTLAVLTLAIAAWLAVVYGSWTFHDNPDPNVITIGNSYVRYWLPLFVLSSVFGAQALLWLVRRMPQKGQTWVLAAVLLLIGATSGHLVFQGDDGLLPTAEALATFKEKKEIILENTEDDAIVIVDRADKYVFPERRVVVPLREERTYAALPLMLEKAPVYYFGITFPQKDLNYLNDQKWFTSGLLIEPVVTISEETLYRIDYAD